MEKTCIKCPFVGEESFFRPGRNICRECWHAQRRASWTNNKEHYAAKKKEYYCSGQAEKQKEFRQKHADRYRQYEHNNAAKKNARRKERMKTDVQFRIKNNFRALFKHHIRKNIPKTNRKIVLRTFSVLPYTVEELKAHLESLFEPWMNWDNWGMYNRNTWDDNDSKTWTWNIDHIIPESQHEYSSIDDHAFLECWALKNLRPYSSKQNIIDGARK